MGSAFKYSPFSLQQKKLLTWWMPQSPYCNHDLVIAEGSVRSGKTVSGIDSFITWSVSTFHDQDFIVASRSIGTLERNVIKPFKQICAAKGIHVPHKRGDYQILRVGSNLYHCFGAVNEASQDVVQGMTSAGAFLDDAALFPQSFVEQAKARCSVDGAKVWMNCNPEGPYHWLKTDYIDKAEQVRAAVFHFTMDDNLSLSQAVRDRYERMFSGVYYLRFIKGLWVLAEGAIYDMWDERIHVTDERRRFSQYIVGIDYGTSAACTFGLYGFNSRDHVRLVSEYYYDSARALKQKTDPEYAKDFKAWLAENEVPRPDVVYCDPSATSFIALLKQMGYGVVEACNDVLDGIRFVAKLLTTGAYKVYRRCKETIKQFSSYVWDPKAQAKGEDKPLKVNDHAMDRDRYALYSHFGRAKFLEA